MILFYDQNCPVCNSFANLLRKKIQNPRFEVCEISPEKLNEYQDFYIQDGDKIKIGKEAIDYLAEHSPEVKDFFWMLPPDYRKGALQNSMKFAKWIRRWILGKKDCDCDKKES